MRCLLTGLIAVLCTTSLIASEINLKFETLVDRFFEDCYFRYKPVDGTEAGLHEFDTKLNDYSPAERAAEISSLKQFLAEFEHLDPRSLNPEATSDRELVMSKIQGELLKLQNIRQWEKNPDQYSSEITTSIFDIMSRNFASPEERLRSVIARERQIPDVLGSARANLRNPPRIYTEIALEQLPGIIHFFLNDVPSAFRAVRDPKLLAEFQASNRGAIDALTAYQKFLNVDLLPNSHGDFRIGAENYRKKLLYDEMVDLPISKLLEIGYRDLRRNQDAFRKTAARIDPKHKPMEVLAELEKDHPAPDQLLQSVRGVLGGLKEFIVDHKIVGIPQAPPPIVEETPPFLRALTFASMDTPGPYEKTAKEAYFNVTLPGSNWSRERIQEFMAAFNRPEITGTAIHEVYPGHYVQFLWVQHAPSKVRKLLGANSNAEGWAHYCEQMMLDEGYGNGDPKLRLAQLQDALLRDARYIVGIRMHTGRMSFEQGVQFFMKEGYQSHANAERETKRGTSDPTYLVYTLGKLEILKLRADYEKKRGSSFSLEDFHDKFLGQGYPPIKLVRRALLGNDSPVL